MSTYNLDKSKAETLEQLTIRGLIDVLQDCPADIIKLNSPHSYRGYYSDLALETGNTLRVDLIIELESLIDTCQIGYKGGDFLLTEYTNVWVADYGGCGDMLMWVDEDGYPVTKEEIF